jgi:hypothetical protein
MNYTWRAATLQDVEPIVDIAKQNFQQEIDQVFTPEPFAYARNLAYAVLNQSYYQGSELLSVALDTNNKIIAYNWAKAHDRSWWSDDTMVNVRMVHVIMDLPVRLRIQLVKDMMNQWEQLAQLARNPIICSTTMRHDQAGFLKLHEREGYSVRGSYAYKRINLVPLTPK